MKAIRKLMSMIFGNHASVKTPRGATKGENSNVENQIPPFFPPETAEGYISLKPFKFIAKKLEETTGKTVIVLDDMDIGY